MGANYLTNQREILASAFLLGNQKSQLKAQKSWPQDLNYRDQDVRWVWSLSEVVKTSLLRGKYILYVYMVCGGGMLSLTVTKTHTHGAQLTSRTIPQSPQNYPGLDFLPVEGAGHRQLSWKQMPLHISPSLIVTPSVPWSPMTPCWATLLPHVWWKRKHQWLERWGRNHFRAGAWLMSSAVIRPGTSDMTPDISDNTSEDDSSYTWHELRLTTASLTQIWGPRHALILQFAYCLDLWTNCSWMFLGPSLIFHRRAAQTLSDFQNTSKNVFSLDGIRF